MWDKTFLSCPMCPRLNRRNRNPGDAAEQVVRMSLETGEVAVKLAGEGAKQLAVLLFAILRGQKKTKGKARLTNMLRSGKELKVFAVKDSDLQLFCREAKKYGVLYCVLKDKNAKDGITDVMVRAEDASKINRIFERFDLATLDMAEIRSEIERSRTKQQPLVQEMARKITGKPALCAADLDLIVAQGALKYNQYQRSVKTAQTPQELYEKGCEADKRHKRTEAFEWYLKAAEQGHAFAMYKVGVCYTGGGRGAKKDLEKSRAWYRKAVPSLRKMADGGDADAAFMLGYCYESRFDKDMDSEDEIDYAQVIRWYYCHLEEIAKYVPDGQ